MWVNIEDTLLQLVKNLCTDISTVRETYLWHFQYKIKVKSLKITTNA